MTDRPPVEIPKAGAAVAVELEKVCMPETKCPAIWDFFDRHGKAIDQIGVQGKELL